jgi:hypothetical protein
MTELIDRGYEDACRQFIEPVVGASGEHLAQSDPALAAGVHAGGPGDDSWRQ